MSRQLPVVTIKRSEAAALIEEIRCIVALADDPTASHIRSMLAHKGGLICPTIPNLTQCDGEAHSNPYIDNCHTCAPRWGLVGPFVKVT